MNKHFESLSILKIRDGNLRQTRDVLAIEEPLQIRLRFPPEELVDLIVTMRTPGDDEFLTAGFLFTEGIIQKKEHLEQIRHEKRIRYSAKSLNNICAALRPEAEFSIEKISRSFLSSSSCGICGKTSIDTLKSKSPFLSQNPRPLFSFSEISRFPKMLREAQAIFEETGGLHASMLIDKNLQKIVIFEDIGRHNSLDKIIGFALLNDLLPLRDYFIFLSGRIGFELIQKAYMAGGVMLGGIGAPSSLAVEMAEDYDITLLGFIRQDSLNIYCGESRISDIPKNLNSSSITNY